jgi:hypothetical protein
MISDKIDPVFGIPLSEDHAFDRKKAMQTLDSYQDIIADHLILLFLADPSSPNIPGWEKELNGWRMSLVRRNRSGGKGKNFSREDLIKAIWIEPLGTPEDREIIINQLNHTKGLQLRAIDDEKEFKRFVARYIYSIEKNIEFKKT